MTDLFPATLDDQIAEVRRELALRERVYPNFVAKKRLTQEKADRHMAAMRAVLQTLEGMRTPNP